MNLEVGKHYATRRTKQIVQIISYSENSQFPFLGDNGCSYTKSGAFSHDSFPHSLDLILEAYHKPKQDQTAVSFQKLELGKQYVKRDKNIVIIVEYDTNKDNKFPFTANDGCSYTKDGHFRLHGVPDPMDIVSEYKPASQPKVIHETSTTIRETAFTPGQQQIRVSLQKIETSVKKLEEILLPERKSKMDPCEFALAFQAWSMAIQAKLSHDLPNVSVEDLARQYGQHTTTPENLDKVSHCFDWTTVMEFIENEKETVSI